MTNHNDPCQEKPHQQIADAIQPCGLLAHVVPLTSVATEIARQEPLPCLCGLCRSARKRPSWGCVASQR